MLGPAASIFSLLLIFTGVAKLRRPDDTARALATIGLPNHRATGLVLGLVEVMIGVYVLATRARTGLLLQALLYLAFACWVLFALTKRLPLASCGCLGTADTPPYAGHLFVDTSAALLSFAAAFQMSLVSGGLLHLATSVVLVVLGAVVAWAVIGDGARLHGALHK